MATLPTPGGDIGTWGPELNEYLTDLRETVDDAVLVANAASTLAQQAANTPDYVLAQVNAALVSATAAMDAAVAAAAAAAEAAALAQSSVDDIIPVSLPPGGTVGQGVIKDNTGPIFAHWDDVSQVFSVNGDTGDVVITPASIGALPDDTEIGSVLSVNGDTGAVVVTPASIDAVDTADLTGLIQADAHVSAAYTARHTHSNASVLNATEEAFTTALITKLNGVATGATANSTDAVLKDRANHTGTQAQSTVTNLVTDLAAKVATTGSQTIAGVKTFSSAPVVPNDSFSIAKVALLQATLDTLSGHALYALIYDYALDAWPTVPGSAPTGTKARIIIGPSAYTGDTWTNIPDIFFVGTA